MALYQVKDTLGRKIAVIHWDGVEPINVSGSISPDDGTPARGAIPEAVTRFQIRAALVGLPGSPNSLTVMNGAFNSAGGRLGLAWDHAPVVRRSSLVATKIMVTLGLTQTEFDDLFRAAGAFEP
jgi:hypothetical protein